MYRTVQFPKKKAFSYGPFVCTNPCEILFLFNFSLLSGWMDFIYTHFFLLPLFLINFLSFFKKKIFPAKQQQYWPFCVREFVGRAKLTRHYFLEGIYMFLFCLCRASEKKRFIMNNIQNILREIDGTQPCLT